MCDVGPNHVLDAKKQRFGNTLTVTLDLTIKIKVAFVTSTSIWLGHYILNKDFYTFWQSSVVFGQSVHAMD